MDRGSGSVATTPIVRCADSANQKDLRNSVAWHLEPPEEAPTEEQAKEDQDGSEDPDRASAKAQALPD